MVIRHTFCFPMGNSDEVIENDNGNVEQKPKTKHKGKHDKPKPSNDPNIDHQKIDQRKDLQKIFYSHICKDQNFISICYCSQLGNRTSQVMRIGSGCNPVFYDQCFYCLGEEGSLGTFKLTEAGGSWLIYAHPQPSQFLLTKSRGFMVSMKKNLFSVFVGFMGKSVHVFQLKSSSTEWVKVTNLGCNLFFFRQTWSLVVTSMVGALKNKINFPMLTCSNSSYIAYSLDNSRFEVLGSDYSTEDPCDAKELLGATWLQPRVIGTTT